MGSRGRKSQVDDWLTEDGLILLEGWAREGLTDKDIAEKKIGIAERTFTAWKAENNSIVTALKKGKAPVDFKVENQLLKSALGYTVTVKEPIKVRTEKQKVGEGKIVTETIEYVEKEIYIPPNVTAQFFWLKNRKPDKWRDKQEKTVSLDVEDLSPLAEMLNYEQDTDN